MSEIDVVISGIGGRFPSSRHIKEFSDNLLSGKSLLRPATRWTPGIFNTPTHVAEIDSADRFDYTFFGMLYQLSLASGPMTRCAVETAYEALIDAGICPQSIKGTNAHVYGGTSDCSSAFEKADHQKISYTVMGKNLAMISNRISFALNLTGRSCSYDVSSGWLGVGLNLAREAIQSGECDTAFVSGTTFSSLPEVHRQAQYFGLLSLDSSCHPFDDNASGVPRGEATITFLVQRADIAKRSYGSITVAAAEPQGPLPDWFLSVNEDHLRQFINRLFNENGLNPKNIQLLEADGLALKRMVEPELKVLDEILNSNRTPERPLLVGSVKTVMGDADSVSGFVALTKLLLAMETGIISPTLDCGKVNPNIPGLVNGRFKVVTEPTPWEVTADTLVAVSTLSTSGVVSQVVLKANGKAKTEIQNNYPLPFLILISGRTEETVSKSLKLVASSPFDPEYLRLTHEVFSQAIDKFEWRGFGIHGETEASDFVVQRENRRPVWFVYSGMGSQWPRMGKELMVFPVINETFQRLRAILEPKGVDLINILTCRDTSIFDNIMHAFVGIAAVQIALTNLLRQLDIEPDGIVGHSVGELGCSYGDGCLTEEQTILASYERGMASLKAELIPGLMAAVGLGYEETLPLLPPDVCVACRNSKESCTISGPTESVKNVVKDFEERGIFVRGVNVSNIAYHSQYIRPAAPLLLQALRKVIPSPKLRSNKWICTSQPKEKWDSDEVRYCSPEYHTNNLLNPVLFQDGAEYIPDNALVIEIAPHGLLQAILRRSLGNLAANVSLTRRAVQSPAEFLLKAVGKLFLEGSSPKIWRLYPDVQMPVSRNTPSLVPLIDWDHSEEFPLSLSEDEKCQNFRNRDLDYSSASVEIAGVRYLVPAYPLVMVLELFADIEQKAFSNLKAHFDDVTFYDLIMLDDKETTRVSVHILPRNGQFFVMSNETLVARGKVRQADETDFVQRSSLDVGSDLKLNLKSCDVYSELDNRCMIVQDKLKDIQNLQCYSRAWIAGVKFHGDWTSLLNALITIAQLQSNDEHQQPTYVRHIQNLSIDTSQTSTVEGDSEACLHFPTSTVVYPGISLSGAEFRTVPQVGQHKQLFTLKFIPFGQTHMEDEKRFLSHVVQLTLEKRLNRPPTYKIYDVNNESLALNQQLQEVLQSDILIEYEQSDKPKNANLLLCPLKYIGSMAATLKSSNTLLLTRYDNTGRQEFLETLQKLGLCIIAESSPTANLVAVGSTITALRPEHCRVIKMRPHEQISADITNTSHELSIFVWENGTVLPSSIMLDQLTTTECPEKNRLVVLSANAPPFSMSLPLYADQIRLNFPLNIFNEGQWGTYQLVRLPSSSHTKSTNIVMRPDVTLTDRNGNTLEINSAAVRIHRTSNKLQNSDKSIGYTVENSDTKSFMGIGTYDERSEFFEPDPYLVWTVPHEWDLSDASALPLAYGLAYYILFEVAELASNDRVLITCPLTQVGQAALRISDFMNCQIIALVESAEEKNLLEATYPKLKIVVSSSTFFLYAIREHFPGGVDVVVSDLSGERLKTATLCLREMAERRTKFIQINPDPMYRRQTIGMWMFRSFASFYGVSEQTLLTAPIAAKQNVCRWVEEGLRNGVIQLEAFNSERLINDSNGAKPDQKTGTQVETFKQVYKQEAYSVIVDGTRDQWMGLAHSLASKGCKHIALILSSPSTDTVRRHTEILQRAFGTELKDLNSTINAADLVKNMGTIDAVFVFQRSSFAEEVFIELNSRGMKNTWVVLFEKTPSHFSWKCDQRAKSGFKVRGVLGVRALPTVSAALILDRLQSPDTPAVIVLETAVYSSNKSDMLALNQTRLLPISLAELDQLGCSLRGQNSPSFREVATKGRKTQLQGEVHALFFIKGIHGTASSEVATLAADLLAPMIEITLHAGDSFEVTALAVVEGILRLQTKGPYNVAGDSIHAPLILEVAHILESRGLASVVFLIDEGIHSIREGVQILRKKNTLGGALLECALSEDVDPKVFKKINWSLLTWEKQIETALSNFNLVNGCQRDNIIAALQSIYSRVQHFIDIRETTNLTYGLVHTLRKGKEYRFNKRAPRCYDHYIPPALLRSKAFAEVISSNLATPVLQLNIERGLILEHTLENE